MRKAILTKFIHLLFLALVLNTFIALVVTSSVLLKRSREDMHFALESVDRMLDYTGNVEEQLMDLSDLTNDNNSRYTLIRMDGTVVADTEVAQVNQMENHLERKEVKDALATGYGYSVRRSGTLGMQMAYAAIRSSDGKYILRLSACSTGLGEYILMLIPAAFLSFGIAFFASAMEAERFSQSITRPLQEISSEMVRMDDDYTRFQFEKCPYEEINVIADTTTRMSRNMKKYLERIEKEKQIRQEFFSNASHELKTPITSAPSFFLWLFANIVMNAPIPKRTGAKNSGFNTSPHSLIDTIQLVTVVPMLAPMMMPVACRRLIIPAFTKPTTITVVAELLWMIAVTPAPTSTPSKRFEVRISSTRCKRLPANFCRPSAIDSIPYRNIPSPPMN